MTYVRKHKEVIAIQLKGKVFDERGKVLALKDDWLLTEGEEQYFMTDTAFKREFELKPPDTPQYIPWPIIPYEPCRPVAPWYGQTWTSDKITLSPKNNTVTEYRIYYANVDSFGEFHTTDSYTTDKIEIKSNIETSSPGQWFHITEGSTIDELTHNLYIWDQSLDTSDLKVSFSVV
jgi:hypothetical protein